MGRHRPWRKILAMLKLILLSVLMCRTATQNQIAHPTGRKKGKKDSEITTGTLRAANRDAKSWEGLGKKVLRG